MMMMMMLIEPIEVENMLEESERALELSVHWNQTLSGQKEVPPLALVHQPPLAHSIGPPDRLACCWPIQLLDC